MCPAPTAPQVYHHALVLFMGWAWLEYTVSLWQAGMLFNTAVHVVMYYYFLLCTLGAPPKWKRWVTRFQVCARAPPRPRPSRERLTRCAKSAAAARACWLGADRSFNL